MADPARHQFHVEASAGGDAFLRVLGLFALAGAALSSARMAQEGGRLAMRLETAGLDHPGAERLARRLRALPVVASVGVGWRSG